MTEDTPVSLLEAQVDEVIAEYLEAERAGNAPDPDELVARHPEMAEELQQFFSDRLCFAQLMAPRFGPRRPAMPHSRAAQAATIDAGRYVDVTFHAKGGLGVVSKANDTELHRPVAHKRLRDDCADNPSLQRRFLLEAEITARLEHPGVVPVHSLYWDEQERPCYTMRFIEGENLEEALEKYHTNAPNPLEFRRFLQSFIQVCETVAYAHSRGVIHRDLKPKNIMLGKFGETLVVDWGLAKIVGRKDEERIESLENTLRPVGDSDPELTQMGRALGTWAYMSPEQAAGRWNVITAASDVYNLGAVLYQILTGRPPMEANDEAEMQQKIQRGDFPRPRTVKPTVPRPLEAVCLRAMAMKPEERYPSARELASEIELWLADEPVKEYPEPMRDRVWRWVKRNKGSVGSGVSACVALVAIAVGTWIVILEREIADSAKAGLAQGTREREAHDMARLQPRFSNLEKSIRLNLDQMASQVGHDPRLLSPNLQGLRKELLSQYLKYWEEANRIDTGLDGKHGWRSDFYRLQQALCLARLGEHQRAADIASNVEDSATANHTWDSVGLDLDKMYDLARVYALCATITKEEDGTAAKYGRRAMDHLHAVARAGYFKSTANEQRLRDDPDLDLLRKRDDFANLDREVEAEIK